MMTRQKQNHSLNAADFLCWFSNQNVNETLDFEAHKLEIKCNDASGESDFKHFVLIVCRLQTLNADKMPQIKLSSLFVLWFLTLSINLNCFSLLNVSFRVFLSKFGWQIMCCFFAINFKIKSIESISINKFYIRKKRQKKTRRKMRHCLELHFNSSYF